MTSFASVPRALVRGIPATFSRATVAIAPSVPIDVDRARHQHGVYVSALRRLGVEVTELPVDDELPDCCFVEDCAVVAEENALITMPGATSRRPETQAVREALSRTQRVSSMDLPATLDGGDCMRVGRHIYVGASGRTNAAGIAKLRSVFEPRGLEVVSMAVGRHLHLKCVCSPLQGNRILLAEGTLDESAFSARGIEIVRVPAEEAYAANALCVGAKAVIMSAGFSAARRAVERTGLEVIAIETTEIAKADGALTCLSILH